MIGFEMSMGADYVPYIVSDPIALPMSSMGAYSEKAAHLPHCYLPNAHARWDTLPFSKPFPAEIIEAFEGVLSLSSFNRPQKIDPTLLRTWGQAVMRVPAYRLTLAQGMHGVEATPPP